MAMPSELQGILAGLGASFANSRGRLSDLRGLDWAWEHSWVTAAVREAAEQQHPQKAELCAELRGQLAALRQLAADEYARVLAQRAELARSIADIESWRAP
jgi:hypothetical protein